MRIDGKTTSQPSTFNVHNVVIVDASGSMDGPKYNAAKKGVEQELELSKKLNYTFSFVEFVQRGRIVTHFTKANPNRIKLSFNGATGNDTPLYTTIVNTLNQLLDTKADNDKFLIKILTDGQDNSSDISSKICYDTIKKAEKHGFTITFVAGEREIDHIINSIGIDKSNTQTHNNTGDSVERSFKESFEATMRYDKNMRSGKDVTFGFYSKQTNN